MFRSMIGVSVPNRNNFTPINDNQIMKPLFPLDFNMRSTVLVPMDVATFIKWIKVKMTFSLIVREEFSRLLIKATIPVPMKM